MEERKKQTARRICAGLFGRRSKNSEKDFRDRAAGDVCRGQKAPCAFNQTVFQTSKKFEKLDQRGENTFSTRWQTARRISAGLFGIYAACMLYLLFFQRKPFPGDYWSYVRGSCNFLPFHTIREQLAQVQAGGYLGGFALRNLAGNVALFVPLGLFLPTLWRPQRRFGVFAATVCAAVLLVECLQVLTTLGSLDVDDLILNWCGACLGFGLRRLAAKLFDRNANAA